MRIKEGELIMNISDAAVEAAAKAHYEIGIGSWEGAYSDTRDVERADMRAALEAAAPYMLGEDAAWKGRQQK